MQPCVLLQLDLDKAYDRIGWTFVTRAIEALGFGLKMTSVVLSLGFGSCSQLLFNRRLVGSFRVMRSIKQGCPLAPLLFTICSHPLALALEEEAAKGGIPGLAMQDDQLLLKMFADDSLLFLKAEDRVVRNALDVIQIFSIASSSQCNIEKSRLISLIEEHSFDPSSWNGKIVHKGEVFRHPGTL